MYVLMIEQSAWQLQLFKHVCTLSDGAADGRDASRLPRLAQPAAFLRAAELAGRPDPVTKEALVVSATTEPVCSVSLSAWRIARGS